MGWYATVSMNATSAVWRVSHSNGLSICCHQYRCSIHWYYPEVAFFFFYHISLILFYFTSCLPWFYFMLIMSSLILLFFLVHHVQLDSIFWPSCPAWFYFLSIMSSLILFLYIMSSLVICFVPSHNAFTRCTDNTGNHPMSATIQPF